MSIEPTKVSHDSTTLRSRILTINYGFELKLSVLYSFVNCLCVLVLISIY